MFNLSQDAVTAFGISAGLSFLLSMMILLAVVARRGLLRVGGTSYSDAVLLAPPEPPLPVAAEMTPLSEPSK